MNKIVEYLISKRMIGSIITIAIGILIYNIVKNLLNKILDKNAKDITKRKKTYIKMITSILRYLMIIIVFIVVLQINGINITSIIAGLGVVSIIAGLALQDALKDIIMGFNLIVDNYFSVGDVIKIDDIEGKVIELGFKVTKLKDVNNGDILVVANRNLSQALNESDIIDINIPIHYEEKLERIEDLIKNEIFKDVLKIKNINNCEYKGIENFGDSAIFYKLRLYAKPEFKRQAMRDANCAIKRVLDNYNIEIPYTQIDIHNKK